MKHFQFQVTECDIEHYAEVSKDRNPIHLNEQYAKTAGYTGTIAHGMLTMAKVVSIVSHACLSPSQLIKFHECTFSAPVYVGDIIDVHIVIQEEQYDIKGMCRGELVLKGKMCI